MSDTLNDENLEQENNQSDHEIPVSAEDTATTGNTEEAAEHDPLAQATRRAEAAEDRLLRVQAEFDNYRKRMQRDKDEALRYAASSIIEELLPVLDNFEMGLLAARQIENESTKAIVTGFEMVEGQLRRFFEDQGVEVIDAVGKPFDHNMHEALGQEETTEAEDGIVLRQARKGYKLKDRLLRPASVYVAKTPENETGEDAE